MSKPFRNKLGEIPDEFLDNDIAAVRDPAKAYSKEGRDRWEKFKADRQAVADKARAETKK